MNKLTLLAFSLLLAASSFAQGSLASSSQLSNLDKSQMDMLYFPQNYPMLKIQGKATEPLLARVIYSRPLKNDRLIFGDLIEYNAVWRLGANEATEIEFFRDVRVGGKKLVKGRYTMFAIPTEKTWTIIFNKDLDLWGAFSYDSKKDAARVDLPVAKSAEVLEAFTMSFSKTSNGADLLIGWDDRQVSLPITYIK